jgi:hypothetical protein
MRNNYGEIARMRDEMGAGYESVKYAIGGKWLEWTRTEEAEGEGGLCCR